MSELLRRIERWFWDIEPVRMKPWWLLHTLNAAGATAILVAVIAHVESRYVLTVAAAFWGIVCHNGIGAWMLRREAFRLGIDLDQRSDEA